MSFNKGSSTGKKFNFKINLSAPQADEKPVQSSTVVNSEADYNVMTESRNKTALHSRETLKNLNPLFHKRGREEDDKLLTLAVIKHAQRSGTLNLSSKGLFLVPEKVYEINEISRSNPTTLEELVAKEEDAWWNRVPLNSLDLSSNSLVLVSPNIEKLSSLTVLLLQNNALKHVPREIAKLEKLSRLNLSRNNITELPVEFFTLPDLRYLNISYNEFEELNPDISDLHMLEYLDVSNNKISELPCGIGFLVRLKELHAGHNRLKDLPEDLTNLLCLQILDLSHNTINRMPPDVGSLRKLQILYVHENNIAEFPNMEGCLELQEFNGSNNSLVNIPKHICSKLPHLRVLDLRNNKIDIIPDEISFIQNLNRLDLTNNSLSNLPLTLTSLANLNTLLVEGNPIKTIRRDIIQRGTCAILRLLADRIQQSVQCPDNSGGAQMAGDGLNSPRGSGFFPTESSVFPDKYKMRKSHVLAVNKKNLSEVPDHIFEAARDENVHIVNFSRNNFTNLPSGLQYMSNCLSELDFANNQISTIPLFVSQFKNITLLNISCNHLSDLPTEFGIMSTLRELNISNNRFESLPKSIYDLKSLEVLQANDNRLSTIDASQEGLGALKRLANLDLRNNNINQVPPLLGTLKQINSLDLMGNPFRQPRPQVIAKGTEAIMSYLRDRIPS